MCTQNLILLQPRDNDKCSHICRPRTPSPQPHEVGITGMKNVKDHNPGRKKNKADYRKANGMASQTTLTLSCFFCSPLLPGSRQVMIPNTQAPWEKGPPRFMKHIALLAGQVKRSFTSMQALGWFPKWLTTWGKFKEAAWASMGFCWLLKKVYQKQNFWVFEAERHEFGNWCCPLSWPLLHLCFSNRFLCQRHCFLLPKLINFSTLIHFPDPLIRHHFSHIYGSECPWAGTAPSCTQRPVHTCDLCSNCMRRHAGATYQVWFTEDSFAHSFLFNTLNKYLSNYCIPGALLGAWDFCREQKTKISAS